MNMSKKEFVRKTTVELIELDEKINVVGLTFNRCKEKRFVELKGSMMDFELYGHFDKLDNVAEKMQPDTNFSIWANDDLFIGKWVDGDNEQDEIFQL